jgi:hypothetical protein
MVEVEIASQVGRALTASGCLNTITTSATRALPSPPDFEYPVDDSAYIKDVDRGVPRSPYVVAFTFTATSHEPPPPFGGDYITEYPRAPEGWEQLSHMDFCLSRASLGGRTIMNETRRLTITGIIRTGYETGAQIVIVNNSMVAKIYDPLYYEFVNDYGYKEDVVHNAEGDYAREAAAYAELQKTPLTRELTPAFFGTYTTDIETRNESLGEKHVRHVQLILIEYLHGETMLNIDHRSLPEEFRSAILKKALLAEATLHNAGVNHYDYCPRNIILPGFDPEARPLRVAEHVQIKVIDFNIAEILTHPRHTSREWYEEVIVHETGSRSKMHSPIVRNHGGMMDFYGWVSAADYEAERWLWNHFHDDERFRPVVWDPEHPEQSPEYAEESESDHGSSDSGISMEHDKDASGIQDSGGQSGVTV